MTANIEQRWNTDGEESWCIISGDLIIGFGPGALGKESAESVIARGDDPSGYNNCPDYTLAAWQNAAESLPARQEQDENDEESLLPCPFCGGIARWGESPDSGHFIECSKCQSSTNLTYYVMDDASRDVRERWNRRVK